MIQIPACKKTCQKMETSYSSSHCPPGSASVLESSQRDEGKPQMTNMLTQHPRRSIRGLSIEPVLFLLFFGTTLSSSLFTNLLLLKSCEFMKLENCSTINSDSGGPNEKIVQPYVALLNMYKSIFESLAPAVMAFFVGPWSDTYGRKPLLLCSSLGSCINFLLLIGFTYLNLAPIFLICASIPYALLGGSMALYTGAFCYVNDISSSKDLAFRMAVAETMLFLGLLCGNAAVPYIYALFPSHGFEGIFFISFFLCLCAFFYIAFLLPESITNIEHGPGGWFRNLFDLKQAVGLFRVCFSQYDGYSRVNRIVLIVVTLLGMLTIEGIGAVCFLFARNKFSWDLKDFSTYIDAALLMTMCGVLFGTTLFSRLCQIPNGPLVCFAYFLRSVSYIIAGIGYSSWFLYVSSAVGALGAMSGPINRALLFDTIPKKDVGKLSAFVSALAAVVPIIASLTYTLLYNSTVTTLPGTVFFFSAAISILCCVLIGFVIFHKSSSNQTYSVLINNSSEDLQQSS